MGAAAHSTAGSIGQISLYQRVTLRKLVPWVVFQSEIAEANTSQPSFDTQPFRRPGDGKVVITPAQLGILFKGLREYLPTMALTQGASRGPGGPPEGDEFPTAPLTANDPGMPTAPVGAARCE